MSDTLAAARVRLTWIDREIVAVERAIHDEARRDERSALKADLAVLEKMRTPLLRMLSKGSPER